jgi:hypothetical protein
MPRKSGKFYSLKYSYRFCTDCSTNPNGTPKVTYIPINKYAKDNKLTIGQCKSMLKQGYLVGMKYKSRMYVSKNTM